MDRLYIVVRVVRYSSFKHICTKYHRRIIEELSYCTQELYFVVSDHEKNMNRGQIRVYNRVLQTFFHPHPNPLFYSGWTRRYCKDINFSKIKIYWQCCISSGILGNSGRAFRWWSNSTFKIKDTNTNT